MKKGKYAKGGAGAKALILVLTVALLVGVSVGGTLAWLTAKSETVTNTFTDSDINITLEETTTDYKMIPGWTIDKDPVVTVEAGSEDCYIFLKVEEKDAVIQEDELPMPMVIGTFDDFIAYAIDPNNWTALDGYEGVYYCKATDITADRRIKVLGPGSYTDPMGTADKSDDVTVEWSNMQVAVKPSVTKQMMDALNEEGAAKPTLTFTAYAVQLFKTNDNGDAADTSDEFTAAEAWAKAAALSAGN